MVKTKAMHNKSSVSPYVNSVVMQNLSLIEKIQNLPPEIIDEVEDFVDFLPEKRKISDKEKRHETLLAFAIENGGTELDFVDLT